MIERVSVHDSFAEQHMKILRRMMKEDPGLIDRVIFFIGVHSEVPADQPGSAPVHREYYTADPLTTDQHCFDPLHIARSAPLPWQTLRNIAEIVTDLREIALARMYGRRGTAKLLEEEWIEKYGYPPKYLSEVDSK